MLKKKKTRKTTKQGKQPLPGATGRPPKKLNLKQPRTMTELAAATGLSPSTVYRMRRAGQIVPNSKGFWDVEDTLQLAKVRSERLLTIGSDSPRESSALLKLKEQHLEATTKLKQITVARLAGKLVPWEDIVQEWNNKLVQLSSRLKGMGRELSPQLENKTIFERERIITDHLRTVLEPILVGPMKKPFNAPAHSDSRQRTG